MNIPKMSQWVIGSGIVIWSVSLIFSAIFYCYSGGTVFDAGGFRCASFSVPSSLIMPAVNPFLVAESLSQLGWYGRVLIIFAVPYIAIPLYWFVLHQIDTAIKRKRGAGAGTNA